jgi:predicted NAD/FAD-binding protein
MSLGDYLKEKQYSRPFIYNYVVPMSAAVWSVPNAQVQGMGRTTSFQGSF